MAANGMFQTTDLREPLRAEGVQLSREQVFRLVTKPPERLNMSVLKALCRIFSCTPNDLIEIREVAAVAKKRRASGGGTEIGSAPALRAVPARLHRPTDQPRS